MHMNILARREGGRENERMRWREERPAAVCVCTTARMSCSSSSSSMVVLIGVQTPTTTIESERAGEEERKRGLFAMDCVDDDASMEMGDALCKVAAAVRMEKNGQWSLYPPLCPLRQRSVMTALVRAQKEEKKAAKALFFIHKK